jgi:hypothetical protein
LLSAMTETYTGPTLDGLIAKVDHGGAPTPAQINRVLVSLKTDLRSGPLADFYSGAVDKNEFVSEAQSLEASFEQSADEILKLQGESVVSGLVALNQENAVGLISNAVLKYSVQNEIDSLTDGPIHPLGTSLSAMASTTKEFESELNTLTRSLSAGSLSLDQLNATLDAEAESYRTEVHASIQVNDFRISLDSDADVNSLEKKVNAIALTNPTDAQTALTAAIKNFDNSVLGTTGLFGARGAYSHASKTVNLKSTATTGQATSMIESVSGTTGSLGTAALTATLTSANGSPIAYQNVAFTLDGAFAGIATTDFVGVATLTGVVTTDAVGTDSGGVVASFASNANFLSSQGTGDLTVNPISIPTALNNVSGTSIFGGTATLSATFTNTASGQAIAGQTVNFSLDGNAAGTALTDSNGIATLSGVTTSDAVGTDANGIFATISSANNYAPAAGLGNLVVSPAGTTLGSVGGTAESGGTASLTATLTSSVTNLGVAGETIGFTLDGVVVGTAVTNSIGIATLTGIATTDAIGTDTGGVVATFAGDANYLAAANATGNLVVSQAATSLGGVSGSAVFGGTATLSATLTSSATSAMIAGQTIGFSLNGTSVGTAVTNSSGIATLTGVATSAGVGTVSGAVVASFAGNADDAATSGTGNLVVTQADSTLNSVSGTSQFGGTATLKATLISSITNKPIAGDSVSFTLNGSSVGTVTTDSNGIATLSGVATTEGVGTDAGAVVASFAGDANFVAAANATGDLVVSQAGTTLGSVSGAAPFGGPATLNATLTSTATNAVVSGQTVTFSLNGKVVGTASTNTGGVASLTGVATSAALGTDAGAVVASFTGSPDYAASSNATGNLVVSQAATTLSSVSGAAEFGGTATLFATLTTSTANAVIAGETVSFTLNGTPVGTAVTDSNGIATLKGVATSAGLGTDAGAVVASFAGDSNYVAAPNGTGDLTVSQAATTLTNVSGTAMASGPATLFATLTSSVTNAVIAGETVDFMLDGTDVGTAVTDNNGIATLTGVPTSDPVGTKTGAVVAKFAGDTDYLTSQGTGDLTVS